MSPSSSISSSEPRRGLRLVLASFTLTCAVLVTVSGLTYWRRGLARHPQDIELTQIGRLNGNYDRLILSDSVTENATRDIAFPENTLPLMTHGWMRLAGQFFFLERVLDRVTPKHVDLFIEPEMLIVEVNDEEGGGRIRHTYTDTLFTRRSEVAELRAAGDPKAGTQFLWFELFYKSLEPNPRILPPREHLWREAPRPDTATLTNLARKNIASRRKDLTERPVTDQNKYFLRRFAETCHDHDLICRVVIEPMPPSLPRLDPSLLTQLMPNVEVIDINDIATFPDAAFYDGWHLHQPDWDAYYRTILSSQGLMQFARRLPPPVLPLWHGEAISFAASPQSPAAHLEHVYGAERWGRWTEGTRAEIDLRVDPRAMRGRSLVLEATGLVQKGPQEVRLKLGDTVLCTRELTASGDITLDCPLPADVGDLLDLTVETSYATSPKEFGEADTRDLGLGLRSLALR